jgi:probable LLM family oxidoreductase
MTDVVELGLDTFGDVTLADDGNPTPHPQVIRDVVEEGVLADSVGVDFFGIGEHHRPDFAVSAPDVVLTAIAARTERIRLGSAVTVLSSDDPIRVFQRFATLDAVSNGRAEVILGRGSFIESFPLFGYDLGQYEQLFTEKLDLFAHLLSEEPVTWEGSFRTALTDQRVYPTTENGLRAWIGVGGSPESVVRAARYGFPLVLAIIGGPAARFAPYADLYRRALEELGRPQLPIAVHSPGHIADTDEEAKEQSWPAYKAMHDKIGAERGWGPMTRDQYEVQVGPHGALYVGSPETVATKIATTVRQLGLDRFDLKYSGGPLPHRHAMRGIELYGTRVIPLVRDMLSS